MEILSIVVPCYNESETLPTFYIEISKEGDKLKLLGVELEIIFIDDGSEDDTLGIIKELTVKDSRVKYLSLSRNFGKEAAMFAGLEYSTGSYVAIMDADLQDPPSYLIDMYKSVAEQGYDMAATKRMTRIGEPKVRSIFAKFFYKLINKISETQLVDGARDYRLVTRQVVNAIIEMKEYNRFTKGMIEWVGFKTKWFEYENIPRVAGKSKWSMRKLFTYSIEGITAFSTAPLAIATILGMLFCVVAFLIICIIILKTLLFGDPVSGWPSLAVMILFMGGIQLFCIGILGQYLSRTYLETKKRPIYIIKDSNDQKG